MSSIHKRMHTLGKSLSACPPCILSAPAHVSQLAPWPPRAPQLLAKETWQLRCKRPSATAGAPAGGCIWLVPHVALHIFSPTDGVVHVVELLPNKNLVQGVMRHSSCYLKALHGIAVAFSKAHSQLPLERSKCLLLACVMECTTVLEEAATTF